jgi:uncharacterized protein YndB with AHSA1/START domain
MTEKLKIDPKLDLVFERTTPISAEDLWKAWTDPQTLMKWFCPRPWKVSECRIDLRAGGEFYTAMQSPEGEKFPNNGCYLEVIPNKKLVWTNMMSQGFRPMKDDKMGFAFTVTLTLTKSDSGTLYKAIICHADEEGRKKHEQMGFQEGWGIAFNQLMEIMGSAK